MHVDADPHSRLRGIPLIRALLHEQIELAQAAKSLASHPLVKSGQLAHGGVHIVSAKREPGASIHGGTQIVLERPQQAHQSADAARMSIALKSVHVDPAAREGM